MATKFSPGQLYSFVVASRTSSVFSVIGSFFIISTFLCFPYFRKPINRLVFFATFGNLLANAATLMSTAGYANDPQGVSALCEFQGVLIQWFLMADSLWVLCMATNVFLVFFKGFDSQQLRHLEKWYLLTSYGIPAIPAIAYIIIDHTTRRIMGPATLWCWIRKDSDWMRIAFFYAPVWLMISATMAIYVMVGVRIFKKRALLRAFSQRSATQHPIAKSPGASAAPIINPFAVANDVVVTSQVHYDISTTAGGDDGSMHSFSSTRNLAGPRVPDEENPLSASPNGTASELIQHHKKSPELREQPSRTGRNEYEAIAFSTAPGVKPVPVMSKPALFDPPTRAKTDEGHAAAMSYLKVAFLMFIALFVVWVPSTINRLYQFVKQDNPSYGLNIVSAVVLPLQGAWNACIYFITTRAECRQAYAHIQYKITGRQSHAPPRPKVYRDNTSKSTREVRDNVAEIPLNNINKQGCLIPPSEKTRPT